MKFQIVAGILLFAVLGAVYLVTEGDAPPTPQPVQTAPTSDEKAMSNLKIN